MQEFLLAFGASFALVLLATLQYGDVADRRWRAVIYEPFIAASAILGIGEALGGVPGYSGYIIGSTLACIIAVGARKARIL